MRFFRDARDDQEQAQAPAEEHPEVVKSDPVPVPQQHHDPVDVPLDEADDAAGPDSAAAQPYYDADGEQDAQRRAAGPWAGGPAGAGDAADEEFAYHEPAPQPTAFGAATVGGAVAASAMAGGDDTDDRRDDVDRRSEADEGVADDRHHEAALLTGEQEGVVRDEGTFDDPVVVDADRATDTAADRDGDGLPDQALEDRGTFDDPVVADEDAGHADDRAGEADRDVAGAATAGGAAAGIAGAGAAAGRGTDRDGDGVPDQALQDRGTFDDPVVVGGQPQPAGDRQGLGSAPGAADGPGPLFGDDAAQRFRDRWRDVQFRFVDDPKGAADEARGLLDEAVDAFSTALRERKDRLGGQAGADDTERLRVEVRSYREFLDRLLSL